MHVPDYASHTLRSCRLAHLPVDLGLRVGGAVDAEHAGGVTCLEQLQSTAVVPLGLGQHLAGHGRIPEH